MDDQAAYLELEKKMTTLLKYLNTAIGPKWGACTKGDSCTMTTEENCPGGEWEEGVRCVRSGNDVDYAAASPELLTRMRQLLTYIHDERKAVNVGPCLFEAGGQTYSLDLTPQECAVVGGWEGQAKQSYGSAAALS